VRRRRRVTNRQSAAFCKPDDSSSLLFYWPMFGTGIGVAITGLVLLGIGGLFGADWERRQMEKYLRRRGSGPI
jgi:2TM domain